MEIETRNQIKQSAIIVSVAVVLVSIPVIKFIDVEFPSSDKQLLNSASFSCDPSKFKVKTNAPVFNAAELPAILKVVKSTLQFARLSIFYPKYFMALIK